MHGKRLARAGEVGEARSRREGSAAERFWSKVDKDGPVPAHAPELGACWIWIGYRRDGYGQSGQQALAHRWAWEQEHGPIPPGHLLHHVCELRACVRPSHLEPVTHSQHKLIHPHR